jgi:hypothetical protein
MLCGLVVKTVRLAAARRRVARSPRKNARCACLSNLDESCGSGRFGASKRGGDDADLDVSPTAMEGSIAGGGVHRAEAVDTSDDSCGSGELMNATPASLDVRPRAESTVIAFASFLPDEVRSRPSRPRR